MLVIVFSVAPLAQLSVGEVGYQEKAGGKLSVMVQTTNN
jgi:hypothetical protein